MKNFVKLAVVSSAFISQAFAGPLVIYGKDDRHEVYEASAAHQLLAKSTAVMIANVEMTRDESRPGLVQLNQRTLRSLLEESLGQKSNKLFSPSAEEAAAAGMTFCEGERFVDQPSPGMCSGFLIAPDLIVTAGHCGEIVDVCKDYKWVFDFEVDKTTKLAGVDVKEENIYECKRIVSNRLTLSPDLDYGVIQLTRRVTGRVPLEIRNTGRIADKQSVLVIGSPSGLPTKVAGGGNVRTNLASGYFSTNLDTFQGNSGSAVFNADTGVVEGILVRGEEDFVGNRALMCVQANVCDINGCRGESVSRMTSIPEVGNQKALIAASITGNMTELNKILSQPFWIDFYTKDGQSALMKAAGAGQNMAMKALIAKGASVNLKDAENNTALHLLAKTLNLSRVESLMTLVDAGANLEAKNTLGETALLIASKNLNLAGIKLLIAAGADKNAVDNNGENVMTAFIRKGDKKAVNELASMGVQRQQLRTMLVKVGLN